MFRYSIKAWAMDTANQVRGFGRKVQQLREEKTKFHF